MSIPISKCARLLAYPGSFRRRVSCLARIFGVPWGNVPFALLRGRPLPLFREAPGSGRGAGLGFPGRRRGATPPVAVAARPGLPTQAEPVSRAAARRRDGASDLEEHVPGALRATRPAGWPAQAESRVTIVVKVIAPRTGRKGVNGNRVAQSDKAQGYKAQGCKVLWRKSQFSSCAFQRKLPSVP